MAAKAIVAERQLRALQAMQGDVTALAEKLKLEDVPNLTEHVQGDAAFRELTRTERTAALLRQIREKVVGKAPDPEPVPQPEEPAPVEERRGQPTAEEIEAPDDPHGEEPEHEGDGEPTFAGKPLSDFEGMDDDAILAVDGIGPAKLKQIRKAQKKAAK